jgi:hypothetical protein
MALSTKLLIDGDIIPYEIGYVMQKDGIADWPIVQKGVDTRMAQIMEGVSKKYEVHDVGVCLTERSFRHGVSTILPYKGQRTNPKPYHHDGIRAYLRDRYAAVHYGQLEADDYLLMLKKEEVEFDQCIVASTDKDLRQIPGTFYSWARGTIPERWDEVSSEMACFNLWRSVLVGDRTDNILGLFGVGEASPLVKSLAGLSEYDQASFVANEYRRRFGGYWWRFFLENLTLLLMVDDPKFKDVPEEYVHQYIAQVAGEEGWKEWKARVDRGLKPLVEEDSTLIDQSLTSST